MQAKTLKQRLSEKLSIPSLPEVVLELDRMISESSCGTGEVGEVIERDPPLLARMLRIANSAYYGLQTTVMTGQHAAAVLGMDAIKNLLIQVTVMDAIPKTKRRPGFDPRVLWRHSVLTAHTARLLTQRLTCFGAPTPELAYLSGLLHDIGQFVLLDTLPDEFLAVWNEDSHDGAEQAELQARRLGMSHTDVGALVAQRWQLPMQATEAIRNHHESIALGAPALCTSIVIVADRIAHHISDETCAPTVPRLVPRRIRAQLGLADSDYEELAESVLAAMALEDSI